MKRAVVLVINDSLGRVLLLQRSSGHSVFPEEWCFPGGKVDPLGQFKDYIYYESDEEACIRECIEETGVVPTLIKDTGIIAVGNDKEFLVKVFRAILPITEDQVTKEFPNREHIKFGFFYPEEVPDKIGTLTKTILNNVILQEC